LKEFGIVPAFWLLDEWSNWLVPTSYKKRSRFDTLFYLCCLDEMPQAVVHEDELESGEWACPKKLMSGSADGSVILAPPQVYEMSRLANFSSVDELRAFSDKRKSKGLIRLFPQLGITSDGKRLSFMQGDDLYPIDMNEEDSDVPLRKFSETAAQLRSKCKNLHRAEWDYIDGQFRNAKVYMSIPVPCGHISPLPI